MLAKPVRFLRGATVLLLHREWPVMRTWTRTRTPAQHLNGFYVAYARRNGGRLLQA